MIENWHNATTTIHVICRQEGVGKGVYITKTVQVTTLEGNKVTCETVLRVTSPIDGARPSPQYMKIIIDGAEENNFPEEYITWLKHIPNNGYEGDIDCTGDNF